MNIKQSIEESESNQQIQVSKKFLDRLNTEFELEKEKLLIENKELRNILVQVVENLDNGGKITEDCSLVFLKNIPDEVKRTVDKLRSPTYMRNY